MIALYFGGIIMGILMALLMRKTLFSGEAVPFVMELPNYRMPGAKNVGHLLWDKAKDFLQRAFTVIFMATLVIWFLQTFNTHLSIVTDSKDSILAMVASVIAPIFKPMGYGDWRISTALITGFMAKRERGINTFYPVWKYSGFAWKYYITFRSESSGFLSAVYTLCGSYCFNQT